MTLSLHRLDPAEWATGLSPAGARAAWQAALSCIDEEALARSVDGVPPRAVLIIASRNVFTAPLEWLLQLRARSVPVLLKPATGYERSCAEMAAAIGGVQILTWRGGDVAAEARALAQVDGVIAFGRAESLAALRARVPAGVVFLGFGPRFGVSVVTEIDDTTVLDHALYDGHGCMSPAAVFSRTCDLDALALQLASAQRLLPRGVIGPEDAAAIRTRTLLARAVGSVRTGEGWTAMQLPLAHFSPVALPRVVVVHPFEHLEEVREVLKPWAPLLGTVAGQPLDLGEGRVCAPGRMQLPEMARHHDGIDVLEALWR